MVKMVYFVYILFTLKKMAEEGKGIREERKVHTELKQKILFKDYLFIEREHARRVGAEGKSLKQTPC